MHIDAFCNSSFSFFAQRGGILRLTAQGWRTSCASFPLMPRGHIAPDGAGVTHCVGLDTAHAAGAVTFWQPKSNQKGCIRGRGSRVIGSVSPAPLCIPPVARE